MESAILMRVTDLHFIVLRLITPISLLLLCPIQYLHFIVLRLITETPVQKERTNAAFTFHST